MTDPLRRDPAEFLRVLKKMSGHTSWQKTMLFASKGRRVGYRMTLDHYNTVLFSQSMWGRALEMIRVVRAMDADGVQPNGASYYYLCNGMANADHGYQFGFNANFKLEKLQHWRVALNALNACEENGFDSSDTMHNSVIISCTIPTINQWELASKLLHRLQGEDRKMHPTMVTFFRDCLIRNNRPFEACELLRAAAEQEVPGYEESAATTGDVYRSLALGEGSLGNKRLMNQKLADKKAKQLGEGLGDKQVVEDVAVTPIPTPKVSTESEVRRLRNKLAFLKRQQLVTLQEKDRQEGLSAATKATGSTNAADGSLVDDSDWEGSHRPFSLGILTPEEEAMLERDSHRQGLFRDGIHGTEHQSHFRPRVYRQEWYKWNAIANKYRPKAVLRKKQLAPRDSPAGIPGFSKM